MYFVDTSALLKRYVREVGSQWLQNLVAPASGHIINISRLTKAEITSALARRLASALLLDEELRANRLPALTFISADDRLCRVAAAEGLAAEDPNAHP